MRGLVNPRPRLQPLSHAPSPSDLCGLCVCRLFSKLRQSRKLLPKCWTAPLGLCTRVIALIGSCFPLLLRARRGVTKSPQGVSHCHQMGGIPMSSHPQHSWCLGLVNPVLPQRTECLAGGPRSQTTCVLSPSRPHRAHLSCSLEKHSGSLLFLDLCSVTLEHWARNSAILTHSTQNKAKPQTNIRGPKALNIPFGKMFI